MSKFPLSRFVPVLKDLVNRRSTWFVRWPYSTPGGTRSIVIVALAPAERLRPSAGLICALVTDWLARIIGPGTLWYDALACNPHDRLWLPRILKFGLNGGLMSQ